MFGGQDKQRTALNEKAILGRLAPRPVINIPAIGLLTWQSDQVGCGSVKGPGEIVVVRSYENIGGATAGARLINEFGLGGTTGEQSPLTRLTVEAGGGPRWDYLGYGRIQLRTAALYSLTLRIEPTTDVLDPAVNAGAQLLVPNIVVMYSPLMSGEPTAALGFSQSTASTPQRALRPSFATWFSVHSQTTFGADELVWFRSRTPIITGPPPGATDYQPGLRMHIPTQATQVELGPAAGLEVQIDWY